MVIGKSTPLDPSQRLGLAISLLLHLVILGVTLLSPSPNPPGPSVVTVTIEPQTAAQRRASPDPQIVSQPSNTSPNPPPLQTLKLAEKDSSTEREQIKRGTDGGKPGERAPENRQTSNEKNAPQDKTVRPAPSSQQPKKPQTNPEHATDAAHAPPGSQVLPLIKDLKLDDATLQQRFGSTTAQNKEQRPTDSKQANTSQYAAFSRPPGSGAAFLGNGGISDHLPNLPDGDITLLNAKANTYAGFVRRVAVQVFGQLRAQGWEKLSMREIQAMTDETTIEAVLSPEGNFLRATILGRSGSTPFDSVVKLSVSQGARDPNPPPGARADDGLIHFIFKARSWSQIGADRRTGAAVEHRWLLLATGLE